MAKSQKVKILVTAGPTWIRIDRVRVLTNIFSGKTGFLIAKTLKEEGFSLTLLLGPARFEPSDEGLKIIRFKYFEELRTLLRKELKDKTYRVVIHSAAVSDYRPFKTYRRKISSSKKEFLIRLKPTPKLIREIRALRPDIYLIQFKLEVGKTKKKLIETAYRSLIKNNSDLVVANDLEDMKGLSYRAYIIDKDKKVELIKTRRQLAKRLAKIVSEVITTQED